MVVCASSRQGVKTLCGIIRNLPASHPALHWTKGSVATGILDHHRTCSTFPTSNFHHRALCNVQQTLPSFRRPSGVQAFQYVEVNHKPLKHLKHFEHQACSRNTFESKQHGNLLPSSRMIHSQKQEPAQRPFILSPQAIVNASPAYLQPYLRLVRLDRPIGTWLLFLPCTFSISLAAAPGCLPDPTMLGMFAVGSILMRGAGCTINDMWDKDFDAKVARTRDRPLACGQLSYLQALTFLGLQLSGALAILLTFNWYTIGLGVSSVALCVTYPLMKRITYWPQAFLGLTFNWGCLMGYSAVTGACHWPAVLPLYAACFAWTIVYDTIYAHQDKEDDILVGVKSTALRMGDDTKYWLSGFTGAIVTALTATGALCDQTWPYYLGVAMFGGHLARQVYTVDLNNADDCGAKFRSNRNLGIMFWLMIMAGNLLRTKDDETSEEVAKSEEARY